jgi:hypothetical protein
VSPSPEHAPVHTHAGVRLSPARRACIRPPPRVHQLSPARPRTTCLSPLSPAGASVLLRVATSTARRPEPPALPPSQPTHTHTHTHAHTHTHTLTHTHTHTHTPAPDKPCVPNPTHPAPPTYYLHPIPPFQPCPTPLISLPPPYNPPPKGTLMSSWGGTPGRRSGPMWCASWRRTTTKQTDD